MAGSDSVHEQLLNDIQPGTKCAWYLSDGTTARGIYDFGDADPVASVFAKWREAIQGNSLLQVDSLDSTQQAAVQFINPNQVTAVKVFPEVNLTAALACALGTRQVRVGWRVY
jgi:hypothetical protein